MNAVGRALGAGVLAGGLHALALSTPVGPLLGLVALVPLLVTVSRAPARGVFAAAIAYAVTVLEGDVGPWLPHTVRAYFAIEPAAARLFALGLLAALGIGYGALLGLALTLRPRGAGGFSIVWIGALWASWEALRLVVPPYFPGGMLAVSQARALPVLQLASVAGIAAVTALVAGVNAAIANAWTSGVAPGARRRPLAVAAAGLVAVAAWGTVRLAGAPPIPADAPTAVAVDARVLSAGESTLDRYVAATVLPDGRPPALVVWPESALPVDVETDRAAWARIAQLVEALGTTLVFGAPGRAIGADARDGTRLVRFNSVHVVRPRHGMLSYHKRLLVPLAESWPSALGAPPRSIEPVAAGKELAVFDAGTVRFAPLVCFEITDAAAARALAERGADLLVNVSNDVWFPGRVAPHAVWARIRAIESGRPVLRAANAGWSGMVDPFGRIVASAADESSVLTSSIPAAVETLYVRTGDVFVPVCIVIALGGMVGSLRRLTARSGSRSCRA